MRREGRLTAGQQRALEQGWPRFGLAFEAAFDPVEAFGRDAPLTLEIGFGNGAALAQMAAGEPDANFIGIEVHRPGVGHLLQVLETRGLDNVRIFCHDAIDVLEQKIPGRCLDRVLLFFPDPWPKRKHHKRRMLQPAFVALIAAKLKSGGVFHMATDWQHYAEQMLEVMEASPEFSNCSAEGAWSERPAYRPVTRFEARGRRLGHGVWDLVYRRL